MSHKYEASEQKAFREESDAASEAEGFTCVQCGGLKDSAEHDSGPKKFVKRVKKAVKEA